ncbi:MAG: alpha/beta fold hydrolase [Planctomycetota bacterium]
MSIPLYGRIADIPFWTDVAYHGPLRLQENARSGRVRVLARFKRGQRGAYTTVLHSGGDEVYRQFEISKRGLGDPPGGKAVVFVHGLGRGPGIWTLFKQAARERGYVPYEFDYASNKLTIAEIADRLGRAVGTLGAHERIDFVAHSMGGIVVRAWSEKNDDPRVRRTVMLGTPNKGSQVAHALQDWGPFELTGPAGRELADLEGGPAVTLPPPDGEFAIVAGSLPAFGGMNPYAPGDDDGVVAVSSTPLAGATDYLVVRDVLHHRLVDDGRVIDATFRFLADGRLRAEGEPTPIPGDEGS